MSRLAAKARCNYYPLPDAEADLIRSCIVFADRELSALDPCAGEGRAMAVITASSKAVRYGIELDSYRAEAATKVLEHVVQGDALNTHSRVESFGLIYANPPFDDEFGESGNRRFEVLFLSHFAAGSFLAVFSSTCCRPRSLRDARRSWHHIFGMLR
jgi:predicted RNA methylase